jgi:hypothetical protein
MSTYSGRAIYVASGRAAYSATSGRALFSDAGLISPSASSCFFGYGGLNDVWNETEYANAQADALAALKADTTLATGYRVESLAGGKSYYGVENYASHSAGRFTFSIPSGKRGSITKLLVAANTGAARFTDLHSWWPIEYFHNSSWDDFGASLKFFFSESATAYTDGDDLYSGVADTEVDFADINDYHDGNGSVPGYVEGVTARDANTYPRIVLSFNSDTITKINGFASDTVYLWVVIKKNSNFPYYLDSSGFTYPDGWVNDFEFGAQFYSPSLIVSDQ